MAFAVAALVGPPLLAAPAHADPPPLDEELADFRIVVPSSLLVAQGSALDVTGVSAAAAAAALANPVTVGTVQSAGGLSVLATGGVTLGAGIGVTVVGGVIGFAVGTVAAKSIGLADYESLCAGSVPVVDELLATVTLTDCTAWELAAEANWDQSWQPDAAAIGVESCDGGGKCATIYAITERHQPGSGAPPWLTDASAAGYCVVDSGPTGLTPSDAPQSHSAQGWFGNGFYANGPGPVPYTDCPTASAPGRVGFVSGVPNGNVPADSWAATAAATTAPVALPGMLRADPERIIRCTLTSATPTGNHTVSAETDPFHLSGGVIPRPVCPAVPENATVLEFSITLVTGSTVAVLASGSTVAGYLLWRDTYPGCAGGECVLDLLRNGESCFSVGVACDGWVGNTDAGVTYSCEYGGTAVDLDECFIYGVLFNATARANGHAYADPSTGLELPEKTSPTAVDRIAAALLTGRMITPEHSAAWPMPAHRDPIRMARYAALQCVDAMETPGSGVSETDCRMKRIFLPGSDVHEAAVNDAAAIASNPAWFEVHYMSRADKEASGVPRDWYNPTVCQPALPDQCDEYPYYTTVEGGPGDPLPRVVLIDGAQNQREGGLWWRFIRLCGVPQSSDKSVLVIPMPSELDPPTMGFCAAGFVPPVRPS